MKKIITLTYLFLAYYAQSATYYFSPKGNDNYSDTAILIFDSYKKVK